MISVLGMVSLIALAYAVSIHRDHINWRTGWLALQITLGALALYCTGIACWGPFPGR
ncbi:MAG: Na+ dependent nucleoside transporter N-terminal domain-containing protein [Pseudohongiellaceae bacterium]